MTSDEKKDRALNSILVFVAVLTAGSMIMLIIALPLIFSGANNSGAVLRGNDLTACRGAYNAEVQANAVEVMLIQSEGLEALVQEDDAAVSDAIERLRVKRDETREAITAYLDAARRSQDDPAAFLAECRERD